MLDKLSEALKSSMKKFIQSIFIDEKTLNQFVNEIQRALLQSDVAVDLVFKISENIKKRAKEEIGKGEGRNTQDTVPTHEHELQDYVLYCHCNNSNMGLAVVHNI